MSGKDLRVTVVVRNAVLLRAIEAAGFDSVAAFARSSGVNYQTVINCIALRRAPFLRDGSLSPSVAKIAFALKALPEDLFPAKFLHQALEKNRITRDLDAEDIPALMAQAEDTPETLAIMRDAAGHLSAAIQSLPARLALVLRMHYGMDGHQTHDFAAIGRKIGVSRGRAAQLVRRAEFKLRHPSLKVRELCGPLMGVAA